MTRKRVLRLLALLASALFAYVLLLCHPDPLFAHSLREGAIVLHSPRPLPARAHDIARAADARIARSPLYDRDHPTHIYLADTRARFALFSSYRYRVGGVAYGGLNRNVFMRPSDIERDRVVRWNGTEIPDERTLTYFIAHEAVHAMLSSRLGRLRYLELPTWQNEGYADYIAKAGAFDYARELQRYREGAPELDPVQSGLYLRYHLSVSYWLDRRGLSVRELLSLPADATGLDATIR